MHIVNLIHVRASETFTITNSKHESMPTGSFYPVFVITTHMHSISPISQIRIQFIPSSPTPCTAVFAKGMVYRHVGQSVAKHLMEVVSAWRRELVHVRTAETTSINDSKHESYPTGSFYSVFVLTSNKHQPHQSNPYSSQPIT